MISLAQEAEFSKLVAESKAKGLVVEVAALKTSVQVLQDEKSAFTARIEKLEKDLTFAEVSLASCVSDKARMEENSTKDAREIASLTTRIKDLVEQSIVEKEKFMMSVGSLSKSLMSFHASVPPQGQGMTVGGGGGGGGGGGPPGLSGEKEEEGEE